MNGDLASRMLAAAVHALPPRRREWGQAMLAELAAIDDRTARRSYARGCVRAVLTDPATFRAAGAPVFLIAFAVATLARAAGFGSAGVRAETVALVAAVGALAWGGRRAGVLGPVDTGRVARGVRGGGYLLVAAVQFLLMVKGGDHDDPGDWWIAELAVAVCLAAFLIVTSGRSTDSWHLRVMVTTAAVGLAAWWVPMLLSAGVRSHAYVALWVLPVTVVAALAATRRRSPVQIMFAALGTAIATCLLIFVAAVGTYAVQPRLVPDIAGPGNAGGLTPADRVQTNRVESTDPYVAELLFAVLLGVALISYGVRLDRVPRASSAAAPVR